MYYNTNKEVGDILKRSQKKVVSQEEKIKTWFSKHNAGFSPCQIAEYVFFNQVPLTSVRRAMTNLTEAGWLEKTDVMRRGRYGKQTHTWRLAAPAYASPRHISLVLVTGWIKLT